MIKKHFLILSSLLLMLCTFSCKKGSDNNQDNETLKIKYEITTSLPFAADQNVAELTGISYTKDSSMNGENVMNMTGTYWSKEVTIENIKPGFTIGCGGLFLLQGEGGTCKAKIYVNGVLKAETNQIASTSILGQTIIGVNVHWINQ